MRGVRIENRKLPTAAELTTLQRLQHMRVSLLCMYFLRPEINDLEKPTISCYNSGKECHRSYADNTHTYPVLLREVPNESPIPFDCRPIFFDMPRSDEDDCPSPENHQGATRPSSGGLASVGVGQG